MKRIPVKILAVMIIVSMLASAFSLMSSAYMAYNIYGNPSLSGTSGIFNTYTIDFRSQMTPYFTYWALANFNLYLSSETKRAYRNISGGGAYAVRLCRRNTARYRRRACPRDRFG